MLVLVNDDGKYLKFRLLFYYIFGVYENVWFFILKCIGYFKMCKCLLLSWWMI